MTVSISSPLLFLDKRKCDYHIYLRGPPPHTFLRARSLEGAPKEKEGRGGCNWKVETAFGLRTRTSFYTRPTCEARPKNWNVSRAHFPGFLFFWNKISKYDLGMFNIYISYTIQRANTRLLRSSVTPSALFWLSTMGPFFFRAQRERWGGRDGHFRIHSELSPLTYPAWYFSLTFCHVHGEERMASKVTWFSAPFILNFRFYDQS